MSDIKGLEALQKKLLSMGKEVETFVKLETEQVGHAIVEDAKNNASFIVGAPPDLKLLLSSKSTNNGFGTKVSQNFLPMGAYMEFGTGAFVEVSDEWKDMAITFLKTGEGRLHATPYLYPAYTLNRLLYIEKLKKKLELLTK